MDNFLTKKREKMEKIGKHNEKNIEEQTIVQKMRTRMHNGPK